MEVECVVAVGVYALELVPIEFRIVEGVGRGSGNIKWRWPSKVHATVSGVEFVARAVVVGVVVCWWTAVLVAFNA